MNLSGFNQKMSAGLDIENEILLPFRSERYLYYKARRGGMLQFVKKPSPEFEADMLTVEALRKEFILCYPLSHAAIIRYTNFEDNALYEEFIDGMTLREMIDTGDSRLLDPLFTEKICLQLFDALDYIHGQGVIHLDIKPENLMITRLGDNLKIIDFGCAESAVCDTTSGYTDKYRAPEQADGQTGCATDIYLAGMVVKELAQLSGSRRRWQRFITATTASDVKERAKSAKEALAFVPKRKKNNLPVFLAALFGIAVVIFAVWMLTEKSGHTPADESVATENVSDSVGDAVTVVPPEIAPATADNREEPSGASPASARDVEGSVATTSVSPKENIEDKLHKEIEQHIYSFYQKNVFPVLKDSVYYHGMEGSHEFLKIAHQALKKGEDDALAFGQKLSKTYPEKEAFINSHVISAINANNSRFTLQLYKR